MPVDNTPAEQADLEQRLHEQLEVAGRPPLASPRAPHGLPERILYPFQRGELPEIQPALGFFTDTSLCIGCKACQVACKEWNLLPAHDTGISGQSYDNTLELSAEEWRHVKFIERFDPAPLPPPPVRETAYFSLADLDDLLAEPKAGQWLMLSDSCKHCVSAPCNLACPTGAIVHTEFSSVFIQPDICNGCASCIAACPFGVITRSQVDGHSYKCTLCYDRLRDGLEPACARACPTASIRFGPIDALRAQAEQRVRQLHERGASHARLYGADATPQYSALHNFYLLLDEPGVYGLPAEPVNPHNHLLGDYLRAGLGVLVALAILALAIAATGG